MGTCLSYIIGFILSIALLAACWPIALILIVFIIWGAIAKHKRHSYFFNGHITDYDNLPGLEFEHFVAEVLQRNGYNVKVTQGSGDYGIDVLAYKNRKLYAIQCKCYTSDVGIEAVQQAYSGQSVYNADCAVVITNRDFTKNARIAAKKNNVKLWNRYVLDSLIDTAQKNQKKTSRSEK
jgi:HJR/Mrr/RecB family endonuclease